MVLSLFLYLTLTKSVQYQRPVSVVSHLSKHEEHGGPAKVLELLDPVILGRSGGGGALGPDRRPRLLLSCLYLLVVPETAPRHAAAAAFGAAAALAALGGVGIAHVRQGHPGTFLSVDSTVINADPPGESCLPLSTLKRFMSSFVAGDERCSGQHHG